MSGGNATDWTGDQVTAVVLSYFSMLQAEWSGQRVVKAELYRRLAVENGRSAKAIEWKLRNVSAVLEEIGVPWISGLLPAHNYQDALVEAVGLQIARHTHLLDAGNTIRRLSATKAPILVDPPKFAAQDSDDRPASLRRLTRKYDPAQRDALNRSLGRAGEQMVVAFEKMRLQQAGRDDLASKVRWVSDLDGDYLGFDVRSFEVDGQERMIEIKTTNGHARTRFWLSSNQCDVAASNPEIFRIRRVYHFSNAARMFEIKPPLSDFLNLTAEKYVAEPR
jgi:hypothetical protein